MDLSQTAIADLGWEATVLVYKRSAMVYKRDGADEREVDAFPSPGIATEDED